MSDPGLGPSDLAWHKEAIEQALPNDPGPAQRKTQVNPTKAQPIGRPGIGIKFGPHACGEHVLILFVLWVKSKPTEFSILFLYFNGYRVLYRARLLDIA